MVGKLDKIYGQNPMMDAYLPNEPPKKITKKSLKINNGLSVANFDNFIRKDQKKQLALGRTGIGGEGGMPIEETPVSVPLDNGEYDVDYPSKLTDPWAIALETLRNRDQLAVNNRSIGRTLLVNELLSVGKLSSAEDVLGRPLTVDEINNKNLCGPQVPNGSSQRIASTQTPIPQGIASTQTHEIGVGSESQPRGARGNETPQERRERLLARAEELVEAKAIRELQAYEEHLALSSSHSSSGSALRPRPPPGGVSATRKERPIRPSSSSRSRSGKKPGEFMGLQDIAESEAQAENEPEVELGHGLPKPKGKPRGHPGPIKLHPLGKLNIDLGQLDKGKLVMYHPTGRCHTTFKVSNPPISGHLRSVVRGMVGGVAPSADGMSPPDVEMITRLVRCCKTVGKGTVDTSVKKPVNRKPNPPTKKRLGDLFTTLSGEIEAGNDAPEVKAQLKDVLNHIADRGFITGAQLHEAYEDYGL